MSNAERLIEALAPIFGSDELEVDQALIAGIVAAAGELATDDVVCVMSGAEHFKATYDGLEGLREAWGDWLDAFASIRFEIERIQDVGENVLVEVQQIGVTRHGGVEITQPSAAVWKFRDDRIVRIEFHLDRVEALRSAGTPAG